MMEIKPLNKETSEFFMKMTDDLLNKLIHCETEKERIQVIKKLNSIKIRLAYELKQIQNLEE
jgi:hypothetical protein